MKIHINDLKRYLTRNIIISSGTVVLLFTLVILANTVYAPSQPNIIIDSGYTFSGASFQFEGTASAKCHCSMSLTLNGKPLTLDDEGKFSTTIDIPTDQNEWKYILEATAHSSLLGITSESYDRDGSIKRAEATVEMDPQIYYSDQDSIDMSFTGLPGSHVTVSAVTSYFVYKPTDTSTVELSTKDFEIDESGIFSLNLPFENADNNEKTIYRVSSTLEGYMPYEEEYSVTNNKFDKQKIDAEKTAWEEAKEKDQIIDLMETYVGSGSVQIAVNNGIITGRTLGNYYVLDPANFHYVSLPIYVKNSGDESIYVNPNYVTVIDGNNRTYNYETATYYYSNYLDSVELQPDTYTSGYLAFIFPKDQHKFTVIYNDGTGAVKKDIYVE